MQKEKRKIRAFTEMSEDGIKALEQKMLNKVKEKILEKKQEEGGKNFIRMIIMFQLKEG